MRLDRHRFLVHSVPAAVLLTVSATLAQPPAGYVSDFEGLTASTTGVQLWDPMMPAGTPGQDNYYWPPGTTSVPHAAYTYAGNTLGVPTNPNGGSQFIVGVGPGTGNSTFSRAQRDISYGCGAGIWTAGTDICVQFNGMLPASNNIGSLSLQPSSGSQAFIMLARWNDANTATNWDADFVYADAAGSRVTAAVPDPAFQNLNVNQWYRWETVFDFTTHLIVEMRVIDLTTGMLIASHSPMNWYLFGGMAGGPVPMAFRFFVGANSNPGNTIAWDNPALTPGRLILIPGCTNPADSLTVASGYPRFGDTMVFAVDDPTSTVSAGSLGVVALSFAPGLNLPCGVPINIPGLSTTGSALIGVPPALTLFSPMPWAPGSPANAAFVLPPNTAAFCVFVGATLFAQGALLDGGTNSVVVTNAMEVVLGS